MIKFFSRIPRTDNLRHFPNQTSGIHFEFAFEIFQYQKLPLEVFVLVLTWRDSGDGLENGGGDVYFYDTRVLFLLISPELVVVS